jgi:gliding motility-associated-like protein
LLILHLEMKSMDLKTVKKVIIIFFLIVNYTLITHQCIAQPMGQWTWMNGSSTNDVAVTGIQGVFAPGNTPRGVYEGCQMIDLNGMFWMYGGLDTAYNQYSDLWEFNPSINQWAWIKGNNLPQQSPVYGTQGVPAPGNTPGARAYGVSGWTDNNGDIWLFGGWNDQWGGIFADLWRYSISTNEWTWMKGPQGPVNNSGVFGTQGIPAPANHPPSRCETTANWVDNGNNFWIFGGQGFINSLGSLNDMWKYNVNTNEWTWMNGPNTINGAGTWGTKGVANFNNIPSARMVYARWKDHLGNFWLFGGCDGDTLSPGLYNDLWKYDPNTGLWTWMSGTDNLNDPGFCFGPCISSTFNCPSGRFENRACTQRGCNKEHFEFFGGGGDFHGTSNDDDLWDYCVALNEWTLMSGSVFPTVNQPSVYGTETVSAPTNHPGGRMGALAWTDPITENFWLYGGIIIWGQDHANDMWRFVVDTTCPHIPRAPLAGFFITPDTGCVPLTVTFTDTSQFSSSFHWTFGDGSTDTVYSPANHTFTTAGIDTVRLIVNGTGECTVPDTMIRTIVIVPQPAVDLGDDTTFCNGISYTLDAGNPGVSYHWSTGATTELISVTTTGSYWVVTSAGTCTDTDTVVVTFIPQPVVNLGNDTSLCVGQAITIDAGNAGSSYIWSTGATTETISPTVTGNYSVTVTNGNNCTGTDTILVTFVPYPVVNLGHDQSLCNNAALAVYGGSPATSYLWQDGSTNSTFVITTAGTYYVTTKNGTCTSYDTIHITLNQAPVVNIGPDIRLCYGIDTSLNAGDSGMTYLWSTGAITQKIEITTSGLYWVKVSQNGCFAYDSARVIIGEPLILNLGLDTFICPGDFMTITPGGNFVSYSWLPGQQISKSITVNQPGTYIVTVVDSNGCVASGSRLVQDFCPTQIYVPNAFTPNSMWNETFNAYGENIESFHMYVFDRWGEQIFESTDISQGWDGNYKGEYCQQGVYVWLIDYKLYDYVDLLKHTITGTVTLLR